MSFDMARSSEGDVLDVKAAVKQRKDNTWFWRASIKETGQTVAEITTTKFTTEDEAREALWLAARTWHIEE